MKQQGLRAARAGYVICKRLKLLEKAYFLLCHSELAWMEQSQAGINAHSLFKKFRHLLFWSWFFSTATHLWLWFLFGYTQYLVK